MTDKVQKIREKVERLMYGFNLEADIASCEDSEAEKLADIKYQLCKKILEYIDSLQEESVSEDLEKVAELYTLDDSIKPWRSLTKEAFIAGARWQKQQTISKACKWIEEKAAKYLVDRFVGSTRVVGIDTSITEDFRKDMEE
jgi:hypothetical protein